MRRILLASLALAMTVLMLAPSLQAQASAGTLAEITSLEQKSREAYEAEKWVSFYSANMKLHQLVPFETEYVVNIVKASAMVGRKSSAYHFMLQLQQQGFMYDFDLDDETLGIRDTEAYQHINTLLKDAGNPTGDGKVVFKLPGETADYRALAWDESRDRFLVGTLREGTLHSVSVSGESEVLLKADDENGLWSITGLAVDADNNRLWIASASTPSFVNFTMADESHEALFELDLKTLEVLGRYNVPVDGLKHELGNVAVTQGGHVYVVNLAAPIIYVKAPESEHLEAFFANPDTHAFKDIAVAPDNSRIFVADTAMGVMVIDPIANQARMLSGPETMNLGGIESVSYRDGHLYIIQGGFHPQRIVRIELDSSGAEAKSVAPMDIALEQFNRPGLGIIQGDNLYYIANTGANDESGAIVMSSPLDSGAESAAPQLNDILPAFKAQGQQKQDP